MVVVLFRMTLQSAAPEADRLGNELKTEVGIEAVDEIDDIIDGEDDRDMELVASIIEVMAALFAAFGA